MPRAVLALLVLAALAVAVLLTTDPIGLFEEGSSRDPSTPDATDAVDLDDPTRLAGAGDPTAPTDLRWTTGDPFGVVDLGLGTATLKGTVLGEGLPLYSAHVRLALPAPAGDRGVRTNEDGTWEIQGVPDGSVDVRARHRDFVSRSATVPAFAAGATVEVEALDLERRTAPANGLVVRVLDEFSRPVRGAKVLASTLPYGVSLSIGAEGSGTRDALEHRAATNERGEVSLLGLAPESYDVVATAPGYRPGIQPAVRLSGDHTRHLVFHLQPGASIEGRVVDPDGNPVAGAFVMGLQMPTFVGSLGVQTREDGTFVLDGLRQGQYWIMGFHEDWGQGQQNPVVSPSSGCRLALQGTGTLTVTVTRPDKSPVPRYRLRPYRGGPFEYVYSESRVVEAADGTATLKLPPGTYNIAVQEDDGNFVDETQAKVSVGETATITVLLPESLAVEGVVADADGRHLAGAEVYVKMGGMPGGPRREQYARTDVDGAFRLPGLSAEVVSLHVEAAGHASTTVEVDLSAGTSPAPLTIRLPQGGAIEGRVTKGEAEPVPNEQVNVYKDWFHPHTTTTDAEGRYRLEGLTAGTWNVSTGLFENGAGGVSQQGVAIADGGTTTVDLDLGPLTGSGALEGRVLSGGESVAGATVTVRDARGYEFAISTTTDAAGTFRVEGLQEGRATVQIVTADGTRESRSTEVAADAVATLEIELGGGGLRGRLVTLEGAPISAAWIQVELAGASDWSRVRAQLTSDGEGAFQAGGLPPGRYQVRVTGGAHAALLTDPFEITEGGLTDLGVYRLAEGAALQGRVVDDTGAPVEDATISMTDDQGRPVFLFSLVTTGSDGRYEMSGLEAGRYTIRFESRGYAPASHAVDLVPGGTRVDGMLSRGGAVQVEVVGESGAPVHGVRLRLLDDTGRVVERTLSLVSIFQGEVGISGEDGVATVPDLTPGTYTVMPRPGEWEAEAPYPVVRVAAGSVSSTRLVVRPRQE